MTPRTAPQTTFTHDRLLQLANIEDWHFWFAGRTSWLKRTLRRYTGTTLRILQQLGFRVTGLDLRPEGLRSIANTLDEPSLVQAEAAIVPFYANMFEAIFMLDVFEHVDAKSTILEISRVLKPGGWLILTVPAMNWLWSYRDHAAGHQQRYTIRGLKELFTSANLVPVEFQYYQFFLFPLVVFRDFEEIRIPLVNTLFAIINRMEVRFGDTIPWPWGSSIFAVCQKPLSQ
jgi:SAM-dependent methyltransferase